MAQLLQKAGPFIHAHRNNENKIKTKQQNHQGLGFSDEGLGEIPATQRKACGLSFECLWCCVSVGSTASMLWYQRVQRPFTDNRERPFIGSIQGATQDGLIPSSGTDHPKCTHILHVSPPMFSLWNEKKKKSDTGSTAQSIVCEN